MSEQVASNPAVQVKKEQGTGVHMTKTGYRVRIGSFPAMLAQQVMAKIQDPPVPTYYNADKEREEPNPNDPDYLRALDAANQERGNVAVDAAVLFGVELLDGLPDNNRWIQKLNRLGIEVNTEDEVEVEFSFLKFIVFSDQADLAILMQRTGVSEEGVAVATNMFSGSEERDTDS